MDQINIKELTIELRDNSNIAIRKISGHKKVSLVYEHGYQVGDKLFFTNLSETKYLVIKIDDELEEALIYVVGNTLEFIIPFGDEAMPYSENNFRGKEHNISMRLAKEEEVYSYRNLAKNVMDQRGKINYYPHSTANVETRNEAVFAARNVIDGHIDNKGHGKWPYESWGTWQRKDAEIIIDFGRKVEVDKIALYLRADFPHDTYWDSLRIEFSDGTCKTIQMVKTCNAQYIEFDKKLIEWIKFIDFNKADESSDFAALTEVQVYGIDT